MIERIPGFPPGMDIVPEDQYEYLRWREDAIAYRTLVHRMCDESHPDHVAARQEQLILCKQSVAYFVCVFGVIHEPRGAEDKRIEDGEVVSFWRRPGWYPWIPFPFQIEAWRFIDDIVADRMNLMGRGDGVVEKARDMGMTWCFCAHVAHGWLFKDDFLVGFASHKAENVDSIKPKSMFYKTESLIGINDRIAPECHSEGTIYDGIPLRIPAWMIPSGFDPDVHDKPMALRHPQNSNMVVGDATTGKLAIGDRWLYGVIDEGSKIRELEQIWDGLTAVTDHRLLLSSPDRTYSDMMYHLVDLGRRTRENAQVPGPRLLSLPWTRHPLRDAEWEQATRNRFAERPEKFEREYELNWNAGIGGLVYPYAQNIYPGQHPYDPSLGQVWCSIDPGIRDPSAVSWFQHDPHDNGYSAFEAWTDIIPNAEYLAPILMGFPRGHVERGPYEGNPALSEVLDTTWMLRQSTYPVVFVGDTAGDARSGSGSGGFYDALLRKSRELNETYPTLKPVELRVRTKYDEDARFHPKRKEVTSTLLPRLRFHDTPRVRYLLLALQSYRYKEATSAVSVSEPTRPQHDWSSHPATSVEYFAVLAMLGERIKALPKLAPQRFVLGQRMRKTG